MKFKILLLLLMSGAAVAQINPENINIVRDQWGVPHIFAKTDPEVAYGLAWAHAEDDFQTIQLTMLSGKGMLGQLKGKDGATIDYVVALLKCKEVVEQQYEQQLSKEFKALISGYVAGINAFAAGHPEKVLLKKSFPLTTKEYMTAIVLSLSVISGADDVLGKVLKGNIKTLDNFKAGGSNAFAISARKTTDGKAYLAINSHQPLEGPVAWYEAHLCSEEGLNILGGLFPGGPVVFHGVNENLGWAHTVNYQDKIDVYQLQINPENKNQYRFDDRWEELEVRKIPLKVKLGMINITVRKEALWSKYGATMRTDKGTFSIRLGANQDLRGVEQWYKMDKARNFSEFYKAMEMTAIPGFNTIYADKNDTIFYVSNGKIPKREAGYDWKNTVPGNTSKTLWTEFHPLKALPQYVSPASGYLVNTNHTPFNATGKADNLKASDFDPTMGYETYDNNRSIRFQQLISGYDKLNYEDFKKIKYDNQYPDSLYFQVNLNPIFNLKTDKPEIKGMLSTLQTWDRKADADSKGAAVFLMVYNYFKTKIFNGEISEGHQATRAEMEEALKLAHEHFLKNFGKTDPTLGEIQKLVRGTIEKPSWGLPDVLTAMHDQPFKDGKFKVVAGESYIELVRFPKNGLPEIESVINFGASYNAGDPHFADQMDMFLEKKTKKMSLDKAEVMKNAVKTYHPK